MLTVLLVLQIIITVAMISVILLQRSSSDGVSALTGGGGGSALFSGRASANILTKTTSILAAAFIINALVMATMTARSTTNSSIGDKIQQEIPLDASEPVMLPKEGDTKNSNADSQKEPSEEKDTDKPSVPISE